MKTIYHVYYCSEEYGEIEGMFEVDGSLISYWNCNDAMWRNEYFDGFMLKLGFVVSTKPPTKIRKACEAQLEQILQD